MADDGITRVLQLELATLRALCCSAGVEKSRDVIVRGLSTYSWKSAEHRIVFDAITGLGQRDAHQLREELPAQATRMGFPDVDWAAYLTAEDEAPVDLAAVARELTAIAQQDAEPNRT